MTCADIIAESQSLTRQNLGVPNATYLSWLNRINRTYCRKAQWPQMRVVNAVLTTVANQSAYDLAADFNRLSGQFVLWDCQAISGGYTSGLEIPFMNQGGLRNDSNTLAYTNLGSAGTPSICYTQAGDLGQYQLVLAPFPTLAGTTVLYNYYKDPALFTSVSDSIPVDGLGDTYTMALCKQIGLYLANEADLIQTYAMMERDAYKAALAPLFGN